MPALSSTRPIAIAVAVLVWLATVAPGIAETRRAVFAGGCFWCVEADFETVRGVVEARSGFSGGHVANPTYRQVTRGGTGHLEAVEILYDPGLVSFPRLVQLFLRSIDPTDDGGQFCDRGDSYRTAIFVSTPAEEATARTAVSDAERALGRPVVTRILPAAPFYAASAYHQDYYRQSALVLTRFGPRSKAAAYRLYRKACGRDARVRALWGDAAPFASSH